MPQKNVAAIHDIAGHGRCSLAVILPILSAAGLQASAIPTAVLSTHTGGFGAPVITDLSDTLEPTFRHLKSQGVSFDSVYSGYLATAHQVDILVRNLDLIKNESTIYIADPVMGDKGSLYSGLSADFPKKIAELCKTADIILPNITEACLLCGIEYTGEAITKEKAELILSRLFEITNAEIVLTGIDCGEKIANAVFDGKTAEYIYNDKIPVSYHGTGDIFASVVLGAVLRGFGLNVAVDIAGKFVGACLKKTLLSEKEKRNGVEFETEIPCLLKLLNIC